ncbi:unnamed protein product, partial [Scytosiphon promiscuus]
MAALDRQGKYQEAYTIYLRAIGIVEEALGPDHPSLVSGLASRAQALNAQGKHEDADPLLLRAIAIQEKSLNPDHSDLAKCL